MLCKKITNGAPTAGAPLVRFPLANSLPLARSPSTLSPSPPDAPARCPDPRRRRPRASISVAAPSQPLPCPPSSSAPNPPPPSPSPHPPTPSLAFPALELHRARRQARRRAESASTPCQRAAEPGRGGARPLHPPSTSSSSGCHCLPQLRPPLLLLSCRRASLRLPGELRLLSPLPSRVPRNA